MMRETPSRWSTTLLVCRRCSKRAGGGFGDEGKTGLAKLLRKMAGGRGRKAAFGVIETKCLKLCPKNAVVLIDARAPQRWRLVEPGTPVETITTALDLAPEAPLRWP